MESLKFVLQIELFITNNDDWVSKDSFYCIFNKGYFREFSSGNCYEWNEKRYHIGKVKTNSYNSFDLIKINNSSYRTEEEALQALEIL